MQSFWVLFPRIVEGSNICGTSARFQERRGTLSFGHRRSDQKKRRATNAAHVHVPC